MRVETYQIQHFAGGKGYALRAMIWLYDENNAAIGNIRFYKNPNEVSQFDSQSSSGFIACHNPPDQYQAVVDLLRNEKPIFLHFNSSLKLGYLSSSREPVGEGDLQGQ